MVQTLDVRHKAPKGNIVTFSDALMRLTLPGIGREGWWLMGTRRGSLACGSCVARSPSQRRAQSLPLGERQRRECAICLVSLGFCVNVQLGRQVIGLAPWE